MAAQTSLSVTLYVHCSLSCLNPLCRHNTRGCTADGVCTAYP